ncbi:hypothetical protein KY332_04505 [Candidatus Woesearchaeota archaeon]|nr:hypothetical protein [Candidatus Woesearchaeota archaeon]
MAYPTKLGLPALTIRYKGPFDFDGLYNLIVQWMKARKYWFHEKKYKHKVPLPTGAEQEITFIGDRDVTEFIKYEIKVDFHLWDMTEMEVEVKGVKKPITNARMQIILSGKVIVDPEARFGKSTFFINIRDFFLKYVLKKDIETVYGDELYYRVNKLHAAIKEFLDMQAKGYEYKGYMGEA